MKNKKKLKLNKVIIAKLDTSLVKGGMRPGKADGWSAGCSDGQLCRTLFNCTEATCTSDCGTVSCETDLLCTV